MLASLFTVALALTHAVAGPIPSKGGIQFEKRGSPSWDYDNSKLRGVNLGGWFVIEPFISPSLFEAFGTDDAWIPVDEYHYTAALGPEEAQTRLQQHWSTWITEQDFANIASAGLNMVRIPIGYWAFEKRSDDPYVQGQVAYLDQAIEWARQNSLKVWVDLHGAPGSQNGFDNSGLRDQYQFLQDENMTITLTVLQQIFDKYGQESYEDVVIGIELINEPLSPALGAEQVDQFSGWAYKNMRSVSNNFAVIQDGFTPANYFDNRFTVDQGYWNIVVDHHHYQVFSPPELQRTIEQHIQTACQWGQQHKSESHWNIGGEWSAALTDCQKWLNGVGRGARYDGGYQSSWIGSCEGVQDISTWSEQKKQDTRRYIEAQLDAFEQGAGWIFWTWKTENSLEWDFQRLTATGLFPSPLTDRQYPNQCWF